MPLAWRLHPLLPQLRNPWAYKVGLCRQIDFNPVKNQYFSLYSFSGMLSYEVV